MVRARGFTMLEATVIVIIIVVTVLLLIPSLGRGTPTNPRLKDASQVRGILQSLIIWAGANKDEFPLPSQLDLEDATVPQSGAEKDTTGNILSLLIYNGIMPPELTVSPGEAGNVRVYRKYETSMPFAAVNPARALWDPGFNADFTGRRPGHTSYATMSLTGARRDRWTLEFSATKVLLGSRGPEITAVTAGPDGPSATLAQPASRTLRFFGQPDRWEGNIGYEDNHVDYETQLAPEGLLYTLRGGGTARDTLFFDEPDDATGDNSYLTVTVPAAGVPGGKAIWD